MSERARLELEIRGLYQVFGRYRAPADSTFCRHCVQSGEDELLRSRPLRQLSGNELARYSFKAISTWGTVDLFKYLLPRLFETVAFEKYRYDPEVLFKKPRYGGSMTGWVKSVLLCSLTAMRSGTMRYRTTRLGTPYLHSHPLTTVCVALRRL
jgi:hypothetical protein